MLNIILVGAGGFLGACLRYIVTLNSAKVFGTDFPYGTLIVNVTGGIVIGIIMELSQNSGMVSDNMKLFLTTGIMGGLTTFSTFSYETISFFAGGNYILAILNAGLNVFLSFFGVLLGKYIVLTM
ncbi:MAG TPA: fluoride efflux transporter CrcB [Clostridiales bacterium]|nr:fluoride efflux transporter CrcB [Clostridiales bacterium]